MGGEEGVYERGRRRMNGRMGKRGGGECMGGGGGECMGGEEGVHRRSPGRWGGGE